MLHQDEPTVILVRRDPARPGHHGQRGLCRLQGIHAQPRRRFPDEPRAARALPAVDRAAARTPRSVPSSGWTRPATSTSSARPCGTWDVPSQNFVYADVDGNIGYQAPGLVPIRAKGDGTGPVSRLDGRLRVEGLHPVRQPPVLVQSREGVHRLGEQPGDQPLRTATSSGMTTTWATARGGSPR